MNQFLKKPNTNFSDVRDGQMSMPLYFDVDLSTARSIAAGTAMRLEIAANSFYSDADTTNGGNATVHFQDISLATTSAPFFVSPGFIANVSFTQILIENVAQPGKRMRIIYGVDIDFQAGVNASIAIAGTVDVGNSIDEKIPVFDAGFTYGASYASITTLAANTPDTIFTPAANTNGAIVWQGSSLSGEGSALAPVFIAKNAAPVSVIDGDIISDYSSYNIGNSAMTKIPRPVKIPAGKGLYFICGGAETVAFRSCLYTLLP